MIAISLTAKRLPLNESCIASTIEGQEPVARLVTGSRGRRVLGQRTGPPWRHLLSWHGCGYSWGMWSSCAFGHVIMLSVLLPLGCADQTSEASVARGDGHGERSTDGGPANRSDEAITGGPRDAGMTSGEPSVTTMGGMMGDDANEGEATSDAPQHDVGFSFSCEQAPCAAMNQLIERCGSNPNNFDCDLDERCGACETYCVQSLAERYLPICDQGLIGSIDIELPECLHACRTQHYFEGCGTVDSRRICDGLPDCPDGADEAEAQCTTTLPGFYCGNQVWIEASQACDGMAQCASSKVDEPCPEVFECRECVCNLGSAVSCPEGVCDSSADSVTLTVAQEQLGDGAEDCPLGDDERQSAPIACTEMTTDEICAQYASRKAGYRCAGTDQYVPRRDVCDGKEDCPDGDDEPCDKPLSVACPEEHPDVAAYLGQADVCWTTRIGDSTLFGSVYECDTGELLNWPSYCDGRIDCPGGEDESRCPLICEGGDPEGSAWLGRECWFPCADGTLISLDAVCDDMPDCSGGEDEPCKWSDCRGEAENPIEVTYCDGNVQCSDGRDEVGCNDFACRSCVCTLNSRLPSPQELSQLRDSFSYAATPPCLVECELGESIEASTVPRDRVADGVVDCPGGDDELAPDFFVCSDGEQIVSHFDGPYCGWFDSPTFYCDDRSDATGRCPILR